MKDNPITPTKRIHTNQVSPLKPNNHDIDMDSDDSESYGLSSNSTTSESAELLNEIGRLKQKLARMEGILSKDDELLNIHILQNEIELLNEKNEGMLKQLSFYEQIIHYERSETSRKGRMQNTLIEKKVQVRSIREAMTKVVFPYIKFVPKNHIKSIAPGSIGARILTELQIDDDDWGSFWATHYEITESLLTQHRTRVAQQMKISLERGIVPYFFSTSYFSCMSL